MDRILSVVWITTFLFTDLIMGITFPLFTASANDGVTEVSEVKRKPEEKPKKIKQIQSFTRFEGAMRKVCEDLASEGRRDKIFELAVIRKKEEKICLPCRALWASLASACRPPKATQPKPVKKNKKVDEEAEGAGEEGGEVEATPTPSPTAIPLRRYPSPALLDQVSRLAVAIYEFDEEGESAKLALDTFSTTLLQLPALTVAERDYYEIFTTFLLAPWQGLPVTPTPKAEEEDMSIFFE